MDGSWVIVLKKGDKIIEKLKEFVKQKGITSGYFNAIGAVNFVELAHYNLEKKRYSSKSIKKPLEIVSLIGNVAFKEEEIVIHAHIVVGTDKMELYGGHLKEATVTATCEIILNEFREEINRDYDDNTGLNLIRLARQPTGKL